MFCKLLILFHIFKKFTHTDEYGCSSFLSALGVFHNIHLSMHLSSLLLMEIWVVLNFPFSLFFFFLVFNNTGKALNTFSIKLNKMNHFAALFLFYYYLLSAAAAKSLQLCLTLCDPIDGSPPGSPIPGILQARTLEWVAISFSNA